jgi:hypothetical protein
MDRFVVIAFVWLASTAGATFLGYLRGRSNEALTLGVLLGPVGLMFSLVLLNRLRRETQAGILKVSEHRLPLNVGEPDVQLRRAA